MKRLKILLSVLVLALYFFSCTEKKGLLPVAPVTASNPCDSIKYSKDIQPILTLNCAISGCHDGTSMSVHYGVFTSWNTTVVKVNDLTFANRVITVHDMPAPSGLSQSDIQTIKCWLDKGALNN
ncbi:MAG: hypothetical protein ACXVP0_07135 [Bacteroidia bacterium]